MSIQSNQVLDRDTLNRAFVSKSATGTQIMAGSLRLLGGLTIDGSTTLGSLTVGSLTTGAINSGSSNITTTGTITAGTFSGSGASLTSLPVNQFGSNRIAAANLPSTTSYTDAVQSITANKTMAAAAILYFNGGTDYYVNAGTASLNALSLAGAATFNSTLAVGNTATFNGNVVLGNANTDTITVTGTPTFSTAITFAGGASLDVNGNAIVKDLDVQGELKSAGANEFPDPLVANTDISMWLGNKSAAATVTREIAAFPPGIEAIASIKVSATAGDAWAYYGRDFEVSPGEWMTFSAYASGANIAGQLYIQFLTAAKVNTATDAHTVKSFTAGAWARYFVTQKAPSDAAYMRVRIDNDGGAGTLIHFSGFQVERGRTMTGFKPYSGGKTISMFADNTWGYIAPHGKPGIAMKSGSDEITVGGISTTVNMPGNIVLRNSGSIRIEDGTNGLMDVIRPFGSFLYGYNVAFGGAGGNTLITSGEGAHNHITTNAVSDGNEEMVIGSDQNIKFFSKLQTAWAERKEMIWSTDGRLGINTLSPTVELDVVGSANISSALTVAGASTFNGVINMNNTFNWKPSTNFTMTQGANSQEWSFDFRSVGTQTGGYWQVWTDKDSIGTILAVTADTARVGIRTSAPQRMLHINGDARIGTTLEVGTGTAANDLVVTSGGSFNFRNMLYSTETGVGIGTVSPTQPLDVNGNIKTNAMVMSKNITVGTSFTDNTNNSPWYGLGYSTAQSNAVGSPTPNYYVQLAGYFGLLLKTSANEVKINQAAGSVLINDNRILTEADEGSGNGLDADTVDGAHKADLMSSTVYREKYIIPTGGVAAGTPITIPNTRVYVVGSNRLQVFRDGILQELTDEYTEASTSTVAFLYDLPADTRLTFVIYGAG